MRAEERDHRLDREGIVRAKLRVIVKRILRKYGYPPDKQEKRDPHGAGAGQAVVGVLDGGGDDINVVIPKVLPFKSARDLEQADAWFARYSKG